MDRYARARADFEFLESLAELTDQVELDAQRLALMRNPSRAVAADLYAAGIRLWLREHSAYFGRVEDVQDIAERYP